MEMSSFIISDLQLFVQRRDLLPSVNDGSVRLQFFRYGLQDLASPDRFWIISPGCREEGYPCNICPDCYVFDNGDLYSRLSGDIDKAVRFLFPRILVLVLLPMWYDCFNGCVCAHSLSTAALIKKKGEPLLVFTGLWFDICAIIFWLASEKYKIVSWKKKSLKTSKISSFSLRLYFVIAEDSLYICTMYCSLL
jgi:hypothetical protein